MTNSPPTRRKGEQNMYEIEIIDDCEMYVEITKKFVIVREDYEEMRDKIDAIIEEYRI